MVHPAAWPLLAVVLLFSSAACGLLVHGTSQEVVCISSPSGAVVRTADGKSCTTPCTLILKRKKEETLTIEKDGYEPVTLRVRSLLLKSSAGQVLLPGGLLCWAIDVASGGAYRLHPKSVSVELRSSGRDESPKDSAEP